MGNHSLYALLSTSYLVVSQRLHPIVLPWRPLSFVLGMGIALAAMAFAMPANDIDPAVIAFKLFALAVTIAIGYRLIPWRRMSLVA